MKIVRFEENGGSVGFGVLGTDGVVRRLQGDLYREKSGSDEVVKVKRLLAPVLPSAVLCTGLNYRLHAEETGGRLPKFPILFMKTPAALQDPGEPILIPTRLASHEVDYECELAIVIGRDAKNVSREDALDYVLGYTCANDVSARDWQKQFGGSQWCRGKTFDTFLPMGPVLVTPDELKDPDSLAISTRLNGETMQSSNTSDMIFSVRELIAFYSGSTTLRAGTVILTGTPSGVGMARTPPVWLKPGDVVEIEIEGIGTLTNPVALEP